MLDNTSNIRDMFSSFPDPLDKKFKIAVRIKKTNSTRVKVSLSNGPPKIDITYPVEIRVLSVPRWLIMQTTKKIKKS